MGQTGKYSVSLRGRVAPEAISCPRHGDLLAAEGSVVMTRGRRVTNRHYYVYMMTNKHNTVLYTGVTNDLKKRAWQHREKLVEGFTKRYNVTKLVYYQVFDDVRAAIAREKQLKKWNRAWKVQLIEKTNPEWRDLYDEITQ